MADSTLSALPKRDLDPFSRSLDSLKSIYDSSSLAERICIPQRPPTHSTPPPKHGDLSFRNPAPQPSPVVRRVLESHENDALTYST